MDFGTVNLGVTVIKGRRSVRKYKDQPLPEKAVDDALVSAHMAPTARNAQPWLFGVVESKETLAKISEITTDGMFIKDAQVCFAIFGEKDQKFYVEDCSAAATQLMLALWAHGVGSCWVAGNNMDYAEEIRVLMGVPEEYGLVALIPAGYPEEMTIPDKKDLDDVVFHENWGSQKK